MLCLFVLVFSQQVFFFCGAPNYFCILTHSQDCRFNMEACSACEENSVATSHQTQRNNAKAKSNLTLKQSCGTPKTAPPTQREKTKTRKKFSVTQNKNFDLLAKLWDGRYQVALTLRTATIPFWNNTEKCWLSAMNLRYSSRRNLFIRM